MTRDDAAKLWPIIKAFGEGRTVQFCYGQSWEDLAAPSFTAARVLYRIKPEPIECWAVVTQNGNVIQAYPLERQAAEHIRESFEPHGFRVIRMVEAP